jgi:transposase
MGERRGHRSWPEALKREIVAASLARGSSVSIVARRYDVNANQVFAWRKRYRGVSAEPAAFQLMPVTVTPDRPVERAPALVRELIEIELAGGYRVRVGNGVKASALRLVLDALERR